MTKEEALKKFAFYGAAWFGNSKQHFAFSAYCRLQGWSKLADKWKEEAEGLPPTARLRFVPSRVRRSA